MHEENFDQIHNVESGPDRERETQREIQERWDRFICYFVEHPEIFESDYILAPGRSGVDEGNYIKEIFHVFEKKCPPIVLVPSDHDAPASFPTAILEGGELEWRLSRPPEDWQEKLANEARAFFELNRGGSFGRIIMADVSIGEGKAVATCGYITGAAMDIGLEIQHVFFDIPNADPRKIIRGDAGEIAADELVKQSFSLGLEQYARHHRNWDDNFGKQIQDMTLQVLPAYGVIEKMGYDRVRRSDYLEWPEHAVEYDPEMDGPYPSLRTPFLEKRGLKADEVGYRYLERRDEEKAVRVRGESRDSILLKRPLDKEEFAKQYQARKEFLRSKIREALQRVSQPIR